MKYIVFFLLFTTLYSQSYIREYTYNASENDSKVSARKAALRQLKVLLIEEVGVQVRSIFFKKIQVKDGKLSKSVTSRYKSFSQALTKSKILEEKWNGEAFYLKAEVNVNQTILAETIDTMNEKESSEHALDKCREKAKRVGKSLQSLDTANIQSIVDDAVNHTFTLPCNQWHFDILSKFIRYDIINEKYKTFVIKSLKELPYPSLDKRASYLVQYLLLDDGISKKEWPVVLSILKKMSTYTMYGMIRTVFSKHNKDTLDLLDIFIKEAQNKRIGLPLPFPSSRLIRSAIDTLSKKDDDYFEKYYARYALELSAKDDNQLYASLHRRYMKQGSLLKREQLISFYKRQEINSKLADKIYRFFIRLQREVVTRPEYASDISYLIKALQGVIQKSFLNYDDASRKDKFIRFMLKHKIDSKMIPTPQELAKQLFSKDTKIQQKNAQYLALMKEKAFSVESKILKRLRRLNRDKFSGTTNMKWALIEVLGNIKATSSKAHDYLIKALSSRSHKVPDHAKEALKHIGKPALQALMTAYAKQETYVQIRIIEVLAYHKTSAVLSFLRAIKSTNDYIKDAVEDALD